MLVLKTVFSPRLERSRQVAREITCRCLAHSHVLVNNSLCLQGDFDETGQPHGNGKYFYAGGETYEGGVANGHLDGLGSFMFSRY